MLFYPISPAVLNYGKGEQNSLLAYNHQMHLLRVILLSGSAVFGLSAIVATFAPEMLLEALGLGPSSEAAWNMTLMGFLLVALSGNMATVSRTSSDRGVVSASIVMLVVAIGLGAVTLQIPPELNWTSLTLVVIGFGFAIAYLVGISRVLLSR